MAISTDSCGAVILAGGMSQRMGRCKALLPIEGKTMLLRTLDRLSDFDSTLISCNDPLPDVGVPTVSDHYKGSGPLAGIHAALMATTKEALLVVPCDLPNFSRELVRILLAEMDDDTDVMIVRDSTGGLHPLCGIYRKRTRPVIEDCLNHGQRKILNFIHQVSWRYLDIDGKISDRVLFNMNTPQDYAAASATGRGPRHALIVGPIGIGKSTLIRRVVDDLHRPVTGFVTVKAAALSGDGYPIHIYDAAGPRVPAEENRVGLCREKCLEVRKEPFDEFAPRLLEPVPQGSLTLMDEIGTLENASPAFRQAILSRLDGDSPILAAVKIKDTPFLESVRSHPNCRVFRINEENRDALPCQVLQFLEQSFSR